MATKAKKKPKRIMGLKAREARYMIPRIMALEAREEVHLRISQRLEHQVKALEEAICPRVAARLTALERSLQKQSTSPVLLDDLMRAATRYFNYHIIQRK